MPPPEHSLTLVLLLATACGTPPPDPAPTPAPPADPPLEPVAPAPTPDPEREARVSRLTEWLDGCAVTDAAYARHKLYTWTRAGQIESLREPGARLLTRERSAGGAQSRFDLAIADDDHPIARSLRRRGRRARRFAWVSPWPTRMGWEDGDYGDRLVEVTLREDAWTARFDPRAEPRWAVVDGEGAPVPDADVRRHPERVAAVLHVADGPRAFREVVLVDGGDGVESMAYATEALRARVAADAERLRELAAHWRAEPPEAPPELGAWLRAGWPTAPADPSLLDRYRQCLALGSAEYAPSAQRAEAIAAALEAIEQDEPFEVTFERQPRRRATPPPSTPPNQICDPTMGCWTP